MPSDVGPINCNIPIRDVIFNLEPVLLGGLTLFLANNMRAFP